MMHVLLVSPHLPPDHVGGVEVYSHDLLRAVAARGHRVQAAAVEHVASGDDACSAVTDDRNGYPTHRLTLSLDPSRPFPLLAEHPPADAWFERLLRETAPDVVHVQSGYLLGAPAMAAARRAGIPVVLTVHDYWFACPRITLRHPDGAICSGPERPAKCAWCLTADQRRHALLDRVSGGALSRAQDRSRLWRMAIGGPVAAVEHRQQVLTGLLQSAAVVLAPTRFVAAQVAAGTGYPLERIVVARLGIPPSQRVAVARGDGLRLMFIGQVAPHKGIHLAVEAVRALESRPVTLDVYGPLDPHPDYVSRLRALAAGDPRIAFHGSYRRDQLPKLFAAADVVVVPSVWHEVLGLVVLEANAAGIPVIASRLGGLPEAVSDEVDGLLFDPARPRDLARQIERLLDEPGLLERLKAALPRPRTVDDEVDALLARYASLVRA
jgi:glycosyltransferase involved in cell wall biosynthesis